MPLPGFELGTHRILNERFTHYTTYDVMKMVKIIIVVGWIFQCTSRSRKKNLIFVYHFVICTSHFLSNARFYCLQTALENKKKNKKKTKKTNTPPPPPHTHTHTHKKKTRPQRMNEVVFISTETSNFGNWNFPSIEKL